MKRNQFETSTVKKAFQVIPKSDRTKVFAVLILQFFLGLLDLAGVAAIGVLGALSVTGVQSKAPGDRVSQVLEFLNLENLSFQSQAATLAALATLILVSRTVFSIIVTRKIFFFLSRRGAVITSEMMSKLLSQNLISIQSRSIQENLYSITTGVSAITLGVLGSLISLIADGSLLVILLFGLIYVDPMIAFTTFTFFGTLGWILYRSMNVKAQILGKKNSELTIEGNQKIIEVLDSFRESLVHNRRSFYSAEIGRLRLKLADVLAETQFLPNVSKYVLESGIIIGAVLISGVQFLMQDARQAVATLAVFLAAGSRIAPAVMRIQQSAIQMRSGLGAAEPTLKMLDQFEDILFPSDSDNENDFNYEGFKASINIKEVTLQYPNSSNLALNKVSIVVNEGESLAIVGPSGAGKTSLVDVLLGVLQPTSGDIRISGCSPIDAITQWPGVISYVPQDVKIIEGTIRENVSLGYPTEIATDELVWSALENAHLADFVKDSQQGLDSQVGEAGGNLSGGQRQRLGIARAFFTKPKLLVLDEATSALDGITELEITKSLKALKEKVTVVTIAHRLSTVRDSKLVVYMDKGEIVATGTFEEVRKIVPDFDNQAKLMGL
jgi:ATP-binding cassette, subfamily B, bacterial PglK